MVRFLTCNSQVFFAVIPKKLGREGLEMCLFTNNACNSHKYCLDLHQDGKNYSNRDGQ